MIDPAVLALTDFVPAIPEPDGRVPTRRAEVVDGPGTSSSLGVDWASEHLQPLRLANTPPEVAARISELVIDAEVEGIEINRDSLENLVAFLSEQSASRPLLNDQPRIRKPLIFLHEDGTFRAVWRSTKESVGVTFLGGDKVEYILLLSRPGMSSLARHVAEEQLRHAKTIIAGLAAHVLYQIPSSWKLSA